MLRAVFLFAHFIFANGLNVSSEDSLNSVMYLVKENLQNNISNVFNEALIDNFPMNWMSDGANLDEFLQFLKHLNQTVCVKTASRILLNHTQIRSPDWINQMIVANAKFLISIQKPDLYQLGNYDECVQIEEAENDLKIMGKYCLTNVENIAHDEDVKKMDMNRNKFNRTRYFGVCTPSFCHKSEIETILTKFINVFLEKNIRMHIYENKCSTLQDHDYPFTNGEIIFSTFLAVYVLLIVATTCFHYWKLNYEITDTIHKPQSIFEQILLNFSLIKLTQQLFSTRPSNLDVIAGIKVISMAFILFAHCIFISVGGPIENPIFFENELTKLQNIVFVNNSLLVDNFIFISGFLATYLLIVELNKRNGKLNIWFLYINRYIRLTPSYIVVIVFYCTLFIRMGDGPIWNSKVGLEQEKCLKSWWTNILYVNNYVNTEHICMFQSWFLSVDFQLFVVAPFVTFPLWKRPKIGVTILIILIGAGILIPFFATYFNRYDPTLMEYAPEFWDITNNYYFKNVYIKTHLRSIPYFLGVFYGYMNFKIESSQAKFLSSRMFNFACVLSWILACFSFFLILPFYQFNGDLGPIMNSIYNAFHRVLWCNGVGCTILFTIYNKNNLISRILSWQGMAVLSRVTYSAYLINVIVEIYAIDTLRREIHFTIFDLIYTKMIAYTILTFIAAIIFCILFESPLNGLQKLLLKRK